MVPMPSVKLSNCALSVEVGERFLGIGLCEYVAHCIMVPSFFVEVEWVFCFCWQTVWEIVYSNE